MTHKRNRDVFSHKKMSLRAKVMVKVTMMNIIMSLLTFYTKDMLQAFLSSYIWARIISKWKSFKLKV